MNDAKFFRKFFTYSSTNRRSSVVEKFPHNWPEITVVTMNESVQPMSIISAWHAHNAILSFIVDVSVSRHLLFY